MAILPFLAGLMKNFLRSSSSSKSISYCRGSEACECCVSSKCRSSWSKRTLLSTLGEKMSFFCIISTNILSELNPLRQMGGLCVNL